jgi:predicted NBD/HSP70 family sugar kinase
MRRGASRRHLGAYNERIVIHALRRLGPASQGDLAVETGLSVPGVSSIVRSLIASGYLRELRSESNGVGRPRTIVGMVPEAAYAVGVHVDPAMVTAVLLDLEGTPVASRSTRDLDTSHPEFALDRAGELASEVAAEASADDRVVGAGLAVPGRISRRIGGITDSVWLPEWNGVALKEGLARRTGLDVRLLKDTHAAVIGELWVRGRDLLEATVVFVYLGMGTGFGLAVAGDPVEGASGNAGQVGRLFEAFQVPSDPRTEPTAQDPVQLVAMAHRDGLLPGPAPTRDDLPAVDREFRELCRIPAARSMLAGAAARVTRAAHVASDLLDAQCVVIGGPYCELLGEAYFPYAVEQMAGPFPGGKPGVRVLRSAQGTAAGATGAASSVLDAQFVPRAPVDRA